MATAVKNVAVFGSTGSIGTNALEVIAGSDGRLRVAALSANCKLPELVEQARQFNPRWIVATDEKLARKFDWDELPSGTELLVGSEALTQVAAADEVDIVLAA